MAMDPSQPRIGASDAQLIFGTDEPATAAIMLRAGRLHAVLRGTRLGPICIDGHEIWHGLDFLHRDTDWGTPRPIVDAIEQQQANDLNFKLQLRGHIDAGARIDFDIAIEVTDTSPVRLVDRLTAGVAVTV